MPHRKWLFGWLVISAAAMVAGTSRANAAEPQFDEAALEHFEKQVRPILVQRCYECHSGKADEPKGGLRLDSREGLLAGGDTGPAVDLAAPSKSLLLDAINYGELYQMPPKSKLPEAEIAALKTWVERGAPWPSENAAAGSQPKAEFDLHARKQSHWAWRPVQRVAPPAVRDAVWPIQTLDAFILAGLEAKGLQPAPPADRRTLLRRVSFDLLGLPPTPAQVEAFLQDRDPHALETVVDELLDSPHFGERWGRHWLDLVRYAESRGHEFDPDVPGAWQYRDYVIRALNADVPYDQFVREHFAGDLLTEPRLNPERGFNESILGTGFWFLGEWVHSPVDIRQDEADRMDNMLDVASKTFLGVTVACARCHDHKFDAISQRDYYALAGFLQSTTYRQVCFESLEQNARVAADWERLQREARPQMTRAAAESRKAVVGKLSEYLLTARDLESNAVGKAPGAVPSANETAEARGLNAEVLARWVTHLREARAQPRDPFHAWAVSGDGAAFEETRRRVLEQSDKQSTTDESLANVQTIVDYNGASPIAWMVDGPIFGAAPVGAGMIVASADVPSSIRIAEYSAARRDPFWNGLKVAPDAGSEPGRSGAWVRADRTLRTPTFTIEADNVYCLVRGSAHIYAVVDSHRVNNGPLHGSLVGGFQNIPQPQWIAHPLARYRGQRAHLEFSSRDNEPLEILQVVQADKPPPNPLDRPNGLIVRLLAEANTPEELASGYRETFQRVVLELSANAIAHSDSAAEEAPLANWLLEHPELTVEDPAQTTSATALGEDFARRRQDLIGKIASESHTAPAMWEGDSVDEFLLIRGNPRTAGDAVPRRLLEALAGPDALADERGSGRFDLARQIASPENPLTARVAVNRVWHHLMGRGIVASVDNFGVLGEPPTHPELLDHLAAQFIDEGWSLKRLIRTIALSRTYQMSSAEAPEADAADPANLLLHRMRIRRLEGEAIRDAILAVSGRLDRTLYGPSIPVHLTAFMQGRGRPGQSGPLDGAGRPSIYGAVRRNFLSPMMTAFDTPAPFNTMGRRNVSNVPAQALILMNDPFVVEQAKVWAERELSPNDRSIDEHIERLYLTAFSRPPSPEESAAARAFLENDAAELGLPAEQAATDPRPWSDLCHALFNVKEFIFVR